MNETNSKDIPTDILEIYKAYSRDYRCADREYLNKTITVKGIVSYVGADIYGLPSVELSEKAGMKSLAICVFPFSNYLKLRKISLKQEIAITGKIVGTFDENTIVMKDCQFVK